MKMKLKNNYNECLTNLACSISKYFGVSYKHNTLDYIDTLLEEKKPQNVVTILLDGMGNSLLDKHLTKDSFFIKNRIKSISTVFPATTVAATTSMRTGLNPCETGMLGWTMYFDECDDTIVTYTKSLKCDENNKVLQSAIEYMDKYLTQKEVTDLINEETTFKGYKVVPYDDEKYIDLDDMFNKIENICNNNEKKYIYSYCDEPDYTLHDLGTDNSEIKDIIINMQDRVYKLAQKINDTIIFVVADHGHLEAENIFLEDYQDFLNCLEELPSIEPRATAFFVKNNMKKTFEYLFKKYFGKYFYLFTKSEIINMKLFGDGEENKKFRSELGDYIAISYTKKAFIYKGDYPLISQHSGYSDEEVFVPLIVIDTNEVK